MRTRKRYITSNNVISKKCKPKPFLRVGGSQTGLSGWLLPAVVENMELHEGTGSPVGNGSRIGRYAPLLAHSKSSSGEIKGARSGPSTKQEPAPLASLHLY